jgi:metal-dependent hydrolase (beta-lactamase superfamily II)
MKVRQANETVTIRVLYDNNSDVSILKTAWGFACLVERGDESLVFDAGADAATVLGNVEALRINAAHVQKVVLSHVHRDHVGGLEGLLATASERHKGGRSMGNITRHT